MPPRLHKSLQRLFLAGACRLCRERSVGGRIAAVRVVIRAAVATPAGYGANQRATYHPLATYADRILRGEKPANLPVERPTKFELSRARIGDQDGRGWSRVRGSQGTRRF